MTQPLTPIQQETRVNEPSEMQRRVLREIGYKTMPAPDVVAMAYRELWQNAVATLRDYIQKTHGRSWPHHLWWRVKRWWT